MRDWLRRTWRRLREQPPRRALRASGDEAVAGTVGRTVSTAYRRWQTPTPIWKRDWDVLVLLDGCRLDTFRTVAADGDYEFLPPAGAVESIWSVGSQSAEWMARTFDASHADEMRRTAYVTGNPFSAQSGDGITAVDTDPLPLDPVDFGWLHEAWRTDWRDGDVSTIPPGPLTDAAIAAWRRREALDVDRVIVHYMQPHAPFRSRPDWFLGTAEVGDWGSLDSGDDDADAAVRWGDLDEETMEFLAALDTDEAIGRDPWTRRRDGDLPAEAFRAAYRDNLEWVLADVARLAENCEGRIAITSDHGNAAGEFGVWSHPPAVHLPALRAVPWLGFDGTDRHTAAPDLPVPATADESATDDARERLADLGYR